MKRILLASASAMLLLSSCGPSKEDIKKNFVKSCLEGTKKEMAGMQSMPQMDAMLNEYCSCSADKAVNNLSSSELKEIEKNQESEKSRAALEKIKPQLQICANEMMGKMQQAMGGMQSAPPAQP